MTTPADELRTAAEKLRVLATAASTDNDGTPTTTWSAAPRWADDPDGGSSLYGDYRTREDGRRIAWPPLLHGGSPQRPTRMQTQHAAYAAAMGPTLGLTLADWLDAADATDPHALAVARQILGTTSTETPAAVDRADLPERLQAVLTERFTKLGNPFSEMRRHEKGPDGWPASHPVGPHGVAEVLRELLATDVQQPAPDVTEEPEFAGTRQCGHDDYHDAHEWADPPHIWCPGHSLTEETGR